MRLPGGRRLYATSGIRTKLSLGANFLCRLLALTKLTETCLEWTFQCYWTYKNGEFVHPQTQEVMVNKEILLLGTNDVNFVNRFLGLFHEMGKYQIKPFDSNP